MKVFKTKNNYQIAYVIESVVCGLIFSSLIAWVSTREEINHPIICFQDAMVNAEAPCSLSFGVIFPYFFKKAALICVGSFLVAYIIQLIISSKYFKSENYSSREISLGSIFIVFFGLIFSSVILSILF